MNRDRDRGPGRGVDWLRRPRWLVVALLALVVVLGACSGDADDEASDTASFGDADDGAASETAETTTFDDGETEAEGGETEADAEEPADDAEAASDDDAAAEPAAQGEDGGGDDALGAGGATVTPTAADLGRKLIFTAQVEVEVDDVAAASAEATDIIEGLGGFLFGQDTSGGAEARSELTFKVLPDDFNRALEALGTVGELRNQAVTTDDVTERIVDLESRIAVAELGVERLRTTLETTQDLEDFAEIERLLLDRESELEVMRGQLRTLEDRVDLATIVLILSTDRVENQVDVVISAYEAHDGGVSCPGREGDTVEAGGDVTVCFDVVNLGDQTLTDIQITDTVLDIDADTQLIEVFGSLEELAPGQSALVAYEFRPERSVRFRTRVVAFPTNGVDSEPVGPSVSSQVSYDLRTFEPESDPGFGDGFSVAVTILRGLWITFTVVVGFLVPMLVLLPFVVLLWWAWREYRKRRPARPAPPVGGPTPPPPPPPGPSPTVAAGRAGSTPSPDEPR